MCGISCCLRLQQDRHGAHVNGIHTVPDSIEEQLEASLDIIKHRGPDSRGTWYSSDKSVAFGHVRLSINDLSSDGAQPFHDPTNQVHAIVNGELYDHEKLRVNLTEKTGYAFKGRSDCEIVIALYLHYGISFLSRLRGEFALCLFDERTQLFIAARDRYGIKPLFWIETESRLLVAAEVKAFLPFGWQAEWDVRSLREGGWNFDQRTLFKGVNKVRPGHYLICNAGGNIEQRQYWDIDFPHKMARETRSEEEMIAGVRSRLLEAVRLRLRADVPVGVYLSGGIDSSVIAGMVTHLIRERGEQIGNERETERVSCFSIAFDEDSGFDESAIANRTADFLGVKYYKKLMNEEELAKRFEAATWHCEHHNPDLNYVGKYALSEVPQELGYKVVLTGEGADETYAGYPMYLADYLRNSDAAWPNNALTDDDRTQKCQEADQTNIEYYKSIGADASAHESALPRRMLNNISTSASMTAFSPASILSDWTSTAYGTCDPQLTIANDISVQTLAKMEKQWHPMNTAMYCWTKGHLANIFLSCLGDRTEMAHSIEARTPFLDHNLTEYVYGLPPSVKIRWNAEEQRFVEKWILREAAKPFITKELYERKKHPYSAPTTYPVHGPLHKLLAEIITKANVEKLGFVNTEVTATLLNDAFVEQKPQAMRLAFVVAQWIVLAKRFGMKKVEAQI